MMKKTMLACAFSTLLAFPAFAADPTTVNGQITDAVTKAATDAATKAATDTVTKAVDGESAGKGAKVKKAKNTKDGPNYGNSMEHRQDGDHGHKGNKKK